MSEKYHFYNTQRELVQKKERKSFVSEKAEEMNLPQEKPPRPGDYFLELRRTIQEINSDPESALSKEDKEGVKSIRELLPAELVQEYHNIFSELTKRSQKNQEHPKREFVDLEDQETSKKIETWIQALVNNAKKKNSDATLEELQYLEDQAWMFFESTVSVINTKSLEKDIKEFYESHPEDQKSAPKKINPELLKDITIRYPFSKEQVQLLHEVVMRPSEESEYNIKILANTVGKIWKQYDVGKYKKDLALISAGEFVCKAIESYTPSLFTESISGETRDFLAAFLEYSLLNKVASFISMKQDFRFDQVMLDIHRQFNERTVNSLFFREFEFIHDTSVGKVYQAIGRGEQGAIGLLESVLTETGPAISGIALSLGFLIKINPMLGAIGASSLPIMYYMARRQNKEMGPLYEQAEQESEKIYTELQAVKSSLEDIKTSAEVPSIAEHVTKQMNTQDRLGVTMKQQRRWFNFKRNIPREVAAITAGVVAWAMGEKTGVIMSNMIYTDNIRNPIQNLISTYYDTYPRYLQDIAYAEKILGQYQELDLPEGAREGQRMSVGELINHTISIENLHFKNILQNINMEIEQGEFVALAGETGVGKSTLLRTISGLYKPQKGEIRVGGVPFENIKHYGSESIYTILGASTQKPQLLENKTLRENLLLWTNREVGDADIQNILHGLHLDKFSKKLDKPIKHASGGELVRFGVARALLKRPKILLLDEPTASLDSRTSAEVRKIITELHIQFPDITIICATHDQELMKEADRTVNLEEINK